MRAYFYSDDIHSTTHTHTHTLSLSLSLYIFSHRHRNRREAATDLVESSASGRVGADLAEEVATLTGEVAHALVVVEDLWIAQAFLDVDAQLLEVLSENRILPDEVGSRTEVVDEDVDRTAASEFGDERLRLRQRGLHVFVRVHALLRVYEYVKQKQKKKKSRRTLDWLSSVARRWYHTSRACRNTRIKFSTPSRY
jgi:hypothetical protein